MSKRKGNILNNILLIDQYLLKKLKKFLNDHILCWIADAKARVELEYNYSHLYLLIFPILALSRENYIYSPLHVKLFQRLFLLVGMTA